MEKEELKMGFFEVYLLYHPLGSALLQQMGKCQMVLMTLDYQKTLLQLS
jgi:hypothetical protein